MKRWSLSWMAVAVCWLGCSKSSNHAGPPGNDGPLSADAGPDTVLALPARDLSLFGHVTHPDGDPVTVRWSVVGGPADVILSAPWALATTATFTTPGNYVFRLTVTDGNYTATSDRKVTLDPASSQTAFYVDPTFNGNGDGSARAPWTSLDESSPSYGQQWAAINQALATNSVIIYFSARQAAADTAEEVGWSIHVSRTDTSSHRLTLDGMSKYNTDDTNPSWLDYTGSQKFRVKMTSSRACCFSIGWYDGSQGSPDGKMDRVTLRGFEVTGRGARITWGGSYSVLEYIWSHDVTDLGATVQFAAAVSDYPQCVDMGKSHDITVRNNVVERGIGEGIYIAGTYIFTRDGGCPSYGNTHSDILIEGNTIRDAGFNGEEGDGMDLKAGLINLTVRGNTVIGGRRAGEGGINCTGTFDNARANYLFEMNSVSGVDGDGIMLPDCKYCVVRNNVSYMNLGSGINITGDATWNNTNIEIYNNTVYGNGNGIIVQYTAVATVMNNLIIANPGGQLSQSNSTGVISDYNLFAPSGPDSSMVEGSHSIVSASTAGIVRDLAGRDFHPVSDSPAIHAAADLSAKGFATDLEGVSRPSGAWDIGAYQFKP